MASIQQRVQADLERNDYALALQRLVSHLGTKGYDPELVTQLGQIACDMRDPYEAGRYWLVAPTEGKCVEKAIATFLGRAGNTPEQIVSQLPHVLRAAALDTYPTLVQERLRMLNLHKAIIKQHRSARPSSRTWYEPLVIACVLVVALFGLIVFGVGMQEVLDWFFGD